MANELYKYTNQVSTETKVPTNLPNKEEIAENSNPGNITDREKDADLLHLR